MQRPSPHPKPGGCLCPFQVDFTWGSRALQLPLRRHASRFRRKRWDGPAVHLLTASCDPLLKSSKLKLNLSADMLLTHRKGQNQHWLFRLMARLASNRTSAFLKWNTVVQRCTLSPSMKTTEPKENESRRESTSQICLNIKTSLACEKNIETSKGVKKGSKVVDSSISITSSIFSVVINSDPTPNMWKPLLTAPRIPCHFAAPSKGSAPLPCMSLRAHIDWVALEGHAPNRRSRSRKSFGNGGRTPTFRFRPIIYIYIYP